MSTTTSTTPTSSSAPSTRGRRQGGPPLLVPVLAFAVLTVASGALGASAPRPDTSAAQVLTYDNGHTTVMTVAAAVLFGSTIPLVISAATLYRKLRRLGVAAPGPLMGFAGGMLAAASLAASALFTWTAAQTAELADPALARALTTLSFATGATGFVVPFGLLVAGIAVPALILRLLPRALAWAGLVIAALALLSTFAMLTTALYPLLPIGRFGGVLFLIAVAALLPSQAHRRLTARP
jgi:hypothetical protein